MSAEVRRIAYQPVVSSAVRAEAQRLDGAHEAVGYGPHSHDFYEVIVFDDAGGEHVVGGDRVGVSVGQAWLLPPGTVHDLGSIHRAGGWVLIVGADVIGVPYLQAEPPPPALSLAGGFLHTGECGGPVPLFLAEEDLIRWAGWLEEIERERKTAAAGYEHAIRALVYLLLVDATRRVPPSASVPPGLVDKALAIVEARFHSQLSLSDVARELAVTPGHLTELVRRRTGYPLGEWIQHRRLAHARTLLAETDQPIGVIAAGLGFADAGTFSRQFRRRHGFGPRAWRAALRRPAEHVKPSG